MEEAGLLEYDIEVLTIQAIMSGLKENQAWKPFHKLSAMAKEEA